MSVKLIQEHTTVNERQESSHERPVEKFKAPKNSLKPRAVDEDPRISHALSIMDNVNKQMEARKRDDIFAAGVATKLRKIKDERKKILVQRDIDNLLYDAIIGTGKYATTRIPSPYSDSSNSQVNDGRSEMLNCFLESFDLSQLVKEPTRITSNSQTAIDLLMVSSADIISGYEVVDVDGISDHLALIFYVVEETYCLVI
ncbi:unnamed protein product [Acanthoscelides obtectus]|uniref:Endonuclease/exonuclease/phosphatase domain-containing protein n=1 Tax=Acanthoscelides obtectus TaxID=200917 RepID=A0A9P0LFC2_ACAOB|nr:unnamed protein product [Acanthoscelides obtectus]CAK1662687.1 hypothetical protein AOBTE_LOCUS23266 [Acanthoscelides obtectus]